MPSRARIWLAILIGSAIGGIIPELWDAGMFSIAGVLWSGVGAFVGFWFAHRFG